MSHWKENTDGSKFGQAYCKFRASQYADEATDLAKKNLEVDQMLAKLPLQSDQDLQDLVTEIIIMADNLEWRVWKIRFAIRNHFGLDRE